MEEVKREYKFDIAYGGAEFDVPLFTKDTLPVEAWSNDPEEASRILALDVIQRIVNHPGEKINLPKKVILDGKTKTVWEETEINLELLNNKEDEGGEVFKHLAKIFWKDLAVHGVVVDSKGGDGKVLKAESDGDGEVCKYLFKLAGVDVKSVSYLNHGEVKEGSLHLDMGNYDGIYTHLVERDGKVLVTTFIDHHGSDSKSDMSASAWVFAGLSKLGLIEEPERYTKLIDFINKTDNGMPPVEVDEQAKKYNSENNQKLSRREFLLEKVQSTVWGLKRFIKAPKLVEFFAGGGDSTKILGVKELKDLGVIYKGAKDRTFNGQETFKANLDRSLSELQKIEQNGFVFECEQYGRIVVDMGGKMGGLGNEISRAAGYDGYLSYKKDDQSFMLTTKNPLNLLFKQGIKVREHMWIKKPDMDGELKMTMSDLCGAMLNKGEKLKFTKGLIAEAVDVKVPELVKKTEVDEVEKAPEPVKMEKKKVEIDSSIKDLIKKWILAKNRTSGFNLEEIEADLVKKGLVLEVFKKEEVDKVSDALQSVQFQTKNAYFDDSEKAKQYLETFFESVETVGVGVGEKLSESVSEGVKNKEAELYDGFWKDLDVGTSDYSRDRDRRQARERLKVNGVDLSSYVQTEEDIDALNTAFHKGRHLFGRFTSKEEAEEHLREVFKPKEAPITPPVVETTTPKASTLESEEKLKKSRIEAGLMKIGSIPAGPDREKLMDSLEADGVTIRAFVTDLEAAGATETETYLKRLKNLARLRQMGEFKAKREYPKLVEQYSKYAQSLGLEWYN